MAAKAKASLARREWSLSDLRLSGESGSRSRRSRPEDHTQRVELVERKARGRVGQVPSAVFRMSREKDLRLARRSSRASWYGQRVHRSRLSLPRLYRSAQSQEETVQEPTPSCGASLHMSHPRLIMRCWSSLEWTLACHARDHGFKSRTSRHLGEVAQLAEHQHCKLEVAHLSRWHHSPRKGPQTSAYKTGFESRLPLHLSLGSSIRLEQRTLNPKVGGSIPPRGTTSARVAEHGLDARRNKASIGSERALPGT